MNKFIKFSLLSLLIGFGSVQAGTASAATISSPFTIKSGDASTYYRIPALVRIDANTLVAFSDLRAPVGGKFGDVGTGHNTIVAKKSVDNGATWGNQVTIFSLDGKPSNFSYGDASVVYDKDTKKILLMCSGGTTAFGKGKVSTYKATIDPSDLQTVKPTDVTDVTEDIYKLFPSTITSLFPTSGRMLQSSFVKKGTSRRIYLGLCTTIGSQVIYTDDGGSTWKVLGTAGAVLNNNANGYASDEVKLAELPDGNVWMSARSRGDGRSRLFNLYAYSSSDFSSGAWASATKDNCEATPTGGKFKMSSSRTNAGIIVLPALRNSDKARVYIALHTIPYGNTKNADRYNLGINWKVLKDRNDFENIDNPTASASNLMLTGWKNYVVSKHNPNAAYYSAYSDIDDNGTTGIDLLYENLTIEQAKEQTSINYYNQVYDTLSIYTITGGLYTYDAGADRQKFMNINVKPTPGNVYLIKSRYTATDGTVRETYLHSNFTTETSGDVTTTASRSDLTAKARKGTDYVDPTYLWTFSEDPDPTDNTKTLVYFSSYNADGYMGLGAGGTDYYAGGTTSTVVCTPLYSNYLKINQFTHDKWVASGWGGKPTNNVAVNGYSIVFQNSNGTRALSVQADDNVEEEEVNYQTYSTTGFTNGKNKNFSTDLIFIKVDGGEDVTGYGTFNKPHFLSTGFPVTFARSDDGKATSDGDYNYYATVKAPFPLVIPQDVKAYKVEGIANGKAGDLVTLTEYDLGTDRILPRETPVLLKVDGEQGNGETRIVKYLALGTGKAFVAPDATTGISPATQLAGTLAREEISEGAYSSETGRGGYLSYLLAKKNGKVAFYPLGTNSKGKWAIAKNKAYFKFKVSTSSSAPKSLFFDFADNPATTGITTISSSDVTRQSGIYTLDGRYAGTDMTMLSRGIYIVGGKKVVKK